MAMAANSDVNPYDEIPYPDLSYVQTHPDRMATLGHILGVPAKPLTQCRVLELGCAAGGNLLPMAVNLPDCEFVGVDYSAAQIEMGQQRIETLGLGNLRLICMDVTQPGDLAGEFDYIIAHGLYSWVERPVRDAMFALCKRVLAPRGILYVSYNTLPGWRITGIAREAMLFHARSAADLKEKARLAKEMLAFLADSVPDEHEAYRAIFRRYRSIVEEGIKGANEAFFLHDELEEVNEPVYFRDFVEHAAGYGLKYFVESELSTVLPHVFGADVMQKLQTMATTPVELEQYMDFLRNRMFRQSLLCHQGLETSRMLSPEPVMDCYVRSKAQPGGGADFVAGQGMGQFKAEDGATLTTDHPLSQAALLYLRSIWPCAVHFDELAREARVWLGQEPDVQTGGEAEAHERMVLAGNLLRGFGHSSKLVALHRFCPPVENNPGKRPVASEVARFEARTRSAVTNLWHERVQVDEAKRQLLLLLDGSKPNDQVEQIWHVAVRHGARNAGAHSAGAKGAEEVVAALDFDRELAWLAQASLLTKGGGR